MKTLDPVQYKIRKENLLQHARHLFATKGFAETSMEDIAQTAHMQKASLYHYFDSKQQILQNMIALESDRWRALLQDDLAGKDFRDALQHIGMTFLSYIDDPGGREFFKIIHFES